MNVVSPVRPLRQRVRAVAATLLAGAFLVAPTAPAQTIPALLPEGVDAALGLLDVRAVEDRLAPFLDEAERLDLVAALTAVLPGAGIDPAAGASGLPAPFDELELLDLLGSEAWAFVSSSAFDPLPSLTLAARVEPATQEAFASAIADAVSRPGTRALEEAGLPFFTYVPESGTADGLGVPLAYAQAGDLLAVSSDPEVIRFMLRAIAGADATTLADRPAWADLAALGPAEVVGFLDPLPLTRSLEPLAASSGADALLRRVQDALSTAGPSVGVLRADDEGLLSIGRQRPDASGPDGRLYELLSQGIAPSTEVLRFAPAGAPAVSAGTADLPGWWAWLDDVMRSAADLGIPSAREAAELFDLDVDALLLDWAGDGFVQIQTAPLAAVEPALADAPLLGEQVVLVRSRDDAAARAGLDAALEQLGATLAPFLDPSGQGVRTPTRVRVADLPVARLELSDTLTIDVAVVDGWALLSGSPSATEAVLNAYVSAGGAPSLAALTTELPEAPRAWSLSAAPSSDGATADALIGQLQLLAGLGGASMLDFAAVDRAAEAIGAYAAFLAERIGPSVASTVWEDGSLVTRQRIYLAW